MKKTIYGECFSEAIGTFLFVLIGIASVAILVASGTVVSYWELAIVWGLSVSLGVFVAGYVSGGHINPAVTISLACWRKFPRNKVAPYILAQISGAFIAALVSYCLFQSTIVSFESANEIVRGTEGGLATAGIFATFPGENVGLLNAFFVEFLITMILMLVIFVVTDTNNLTAPTGGLAALVIGITVALCGLAFGPLTGFAMNPARDFGPRLFTLIAGWGTAALGSDFYGLIVPIFGPILGAIFAGVIYFKLITPYYPKK
ncbi:MIP/aquaporin family protein [Amphibacillus sp. Q70]|uniref:MIP/aquaporin family protein n=1 Tax=Amphibacillus sp. Q70 TaxID=3453416 RepID=UPI003F8719D1